MSFKNDKGDMEYYLTAGAFHNEVEAYGKDGFNEMHHTHPDNSSTDPSGFIFELPAHQQYDGALQIRQGEGRWSTITTHVSGSDGIKPWAIRFRVVKTKGEADSFAAHRGTEKLFTGTMRNISEQTAVEVRDQATKGYAAVSTEIDGTHMLIEAYPKELAPADFFMTEPLAAVTANPDRNLKNLADWVEPWISQYLSSTTTPAGRKKLQALATAYFAQIDAEAARRYSGEGDDFLRKEFSRKLKKAFVNKLLNAKLNQEDLGILLALANSRRAYPQTENEHVVVEALLEAASSKPVIQAFLDEHYTLAVTQFNLEQLSSLGEKSQKYVMSMPKDLFFNASREVSTGNSMRPVDVFAKLSEGLPLSYIVAGEKVLIYGAFQVGISAGVKGRALLDQDWDSRRPAEETLAAFDAGFVELVQAPEVQPGELNLSSAVQNVLLQQFLNKALFAGTPELREHVLRLSDPIVLSRVLIKARAQASFDVVRSLSQFIGKMLHAYYEGRPEMQPAAKLLDLQPWLEPATQEQILAYLNNEKIFGLLQGAGWSGAAIQPQDLTGLARVEALLAIVSRAFGMKMADVVSLSYFVSGTGISDARLLDYVNAYHAAEFKRSFTPEDLQDPVVVKRLTQILSLEPVNSVEVVKGLLGGLFRNPRAPVAADRQQQSRLLYQRQERAGALTEALGRPVKAAEFDQPDSLQKIAAELGDEGYEFTVEPANIEALWAEFEPQFAQKQREDAREKFAEALNKALKEKGKDLTVDPAKLVAEKGAAGADVAEVKAYLNRIARELDLEGDMQDAEMLRQVFDAQELGARRTNAKKKLVEELTAVLGREITGETLENEAAELAQELKLKDSAAIVNWFDLHDAYYRQKALKKFAESLTAALEKSGKTRRVSEADLDDSTETGRQSIAAIAGDLALGENITTVSALADAFDAKSQEMQQREMFLPILLQMLSKMPELTGEALTLELLKNPAELARIAAKIGLENVTDPMELLMAVQKRNAVQREQADKAQLAQTLSVAPESLDDAEQIKQHLADLKSRKQLPEAAAAATWQELKGALDEYAEVVAKKTKLAQALSAELSESVTVEMLESDTQRLTEALVAKHVLTDSSAIRTWEDLEKAYTAAKSREFFEEFAGSLNAELAAAGKSRTVSAAELMNPTPEQPQLIASIASDLGLGEDVTTLKGLYEAVRMKSQEDGQQDMIVSVLTDMLSKLPEFESEVLTAERLKDPAELVRIAGKLGLPQATNPMELFMALQQRGADQEERLNKSHLADYLTRFSGTQVSDETLDDPVQIANFVALLIQQGQLPEDAAAADWNELHAALEAQARRSAIQNFAEDLADELEDASITGELLSAADEGVIAGIAERLSLELEQNTLEALYQAYNARSEMRAPMAGAAGLGATPFISAGDAINAVIYSPSGRALGLDVQAIEYRDGGGRFEMVDSLINPESGKQVVAQYDAGKDVITLNRSELRHLAAQTGATFEQAAVTALAHELYHASNSEDFREKLAAMFGVREADYAEEIQAWTVTLMAMKLVNPEAFASQIVRLEAFVRLWHAQSVLRPQIDSILHHTSLTETMMQAVKPTTFAVGGAHAELGEAAKQGGLERVDASVTALEAAIDRAHSTGVGYNHMVLLLSAADADPSAQAAVTTVLGKAKYAGIRVYLSYDLKEPGQTAEAVVDAATGLAYLGTEQAAQAMELPLSQREVSVTSLMAKVGQLLTAFKAQVEAAVSA